jgi:ankyrin repeat protein/CHAT domain-containing protein/tetratricopeptide (TPR) repeat protein
VDGQPKPPSPTERLFFAVRDGNLQTTAELLALGVTPHLRESSSGLTPLHVAAYRGNTEAVRLLLAYGADPNLRDSIRVTPLHAAAYHGHTEIVRELLAVGVELECRNEQGFTPLHDAANQGHGEVIQLLLDAGANIEATANKRETPLHMAAHYGREEAVRTLIEGGAHRHEKTVDGITPLLLAADQRHLPVVRLLLDARQGGSGTGSPAGTTNSEAWELFRRAADLRRQWQEESPGVQAEALFREAIRRFPDRWEGHYGLGEVLHLKANRERSKPGPWIGEMLRELRQAAELAPDHIEPALKLAKAVADLDVESAGPLYRKAVDTTVPGRPTLYDESWQAGDHWDIAIRAAGKAGHEALSFEAFCRAIDHDPSYYGGYVMPAEDRAQSIWSLALLVKPGGARRPKASRRESQLRQALDSVPQQPDLASLHNQSLLVGQRYLRTNELADLNEALDLAHGAVRLAPAHPKALSNQGYLLKLLYDRLGRPEDLSASIASFETAVGNSENGAERLSDLNNLALLRHLLYARTSQLDHLERSIEAAEEVVEATPKSSPRLPMYICNLGVKLLERYKRIGAIEDLETTIRIYEEGLLELLPESPYRPTFVYNLAIALRNRFDQNDEIDDLNRAIGYFEEACDHTPKDSLDYPIRLNGLSTGLLNRYSEGGSIEDLKRSIAILEIAVDRTDPDSPAFPLRLANLAHALVLLWETDRNRPDLERSIALYERLGQITSPESSMWPIYLLNHGSALVLKWQSSGSSDDWRRAIDTLRQSAHSGRDTAVQAVLGAASQWLSLAVLEEEWDEAQRAYRNAWEASEKLVRIQFLRRDKESWLQHTQGLAASAAFAFAKTGRFAEAAETLERGQARLLGETLAKERLAFEHLEASGRGDLLERYREAIGQILHFSDQEAPSPEARARIDQARVEIERIIETVQSLEGFEDFLQPAAFADVQRAAELRPLIYIAATPAGGLALVTGTGPAELISPVWLPELTTDALRSALWGTQTSGEQGLLGARRAWQQSRDVRHLRAWLSSIEGCGRWLWDSVFAPILQATPKLREASLIPIGSLGLLPLHTAWREDPARPTGRIYLLDLLTVSYTPNARALLGARAIAERVAPRKLLAVDEPRPTFMAPLPSAAPEVCAVAAHFTDPKIIRHQEATRDSVLSALPGYDVLHFSCHGCAELADPLSSSLLMAHNERLTLGDILNLRLAGVRLAVLSACETGMAGVRLPEEVVSLPSGLLQAGAAGVISSLASVDDFSTMLLISSFYGLWMRGASEPAQALRHAQIWMRDTTNGEKVRTAEEALRGLSRPGNPWWPPETARAIVAELSSWNPEARDFSHPSHWGVFHYVGA